MQLSTLNDIYRYAEGLGIFAPDHEAMKMYNRNLFDLDDSFAERAKVDFYLLAHGRAIARIRSLAKDLNLAIVDIAMMRGQISLEPLLLGDLRAIERELRGRLQRETEVTA